MTEPETPVEVIAAALGTHPQDPELRRERARSILDALPPGWQLTGPLPVPRPVTAVERDTALAFREALRLYRSQHADECGCEACSAYEDSTDEVEGPPGAGLHSKACGTGPMREPRTEAGQEMYAYWLDDQPRDAEKAREIIVAIEDEAADRERQRVAAGLHAQFVKDNAESSRCTQYLAGNERHRCALSWGHAGAHRLSDPTTP